MNPSSLREFGIKRENEERRDGGCAVVFDPKTQLYAVCVNDIGGAYRLCSGGIAADEDIQEGVLREVVEESGLYDFGHIEKIEQVWTHFHNALKKVNRVALATCYLVVLNSAATRPTQLEAHEKFTLAWKSAPEILENWKERNQNEDYSHWIYLFEKSLVRVRELGLEK